MGRTRRKVGDRCGCWLVLERLPPRRTANSAQPVYRYRCRCRCGTESTVSSSTLSNRPERCSACPSPNDGRTGRRKWNVGVRAGDFVIEELLAESAGNRRYLLRCGRGHYKVMFLSRLSSEYPRCATCELKKQVNELKHELKLQLREANRKLPPSAVRDSTGKTLTEWGEIYGVSREAIRQRMARHGSPHPPR